MSTESVRHRGVTAARWPVSVRMTGRTGRQGGRGQCRGGRRGNDTSLGGRLTNPRFTEPDRQVRAGTGPRARKVTLSMGETAQEVALLDGVGRQER